MQSNSHLEEAVLIKGYLNKKNRYGFNQQRFLTLSHSGEVKYYKGTTEYCGAFKIGPMTNVTKDLNDKSFTLKNLER